METISTRVRDFRFCDAPLSLFSFSRLIVLRLHHPLHRPSIHLFPKFAILKVLAVTLVTCSDECSSAVTPSIWAHSWNSQASSEFHCIACAASGYVGHCPFVIFLRERERETDRESDVKSAALPLPGRSLARSVYSSHLNGKWRRWSGVPDCSLKQSSPGPGPLPTAHSSR